MARSPAKVPSAIAAGSVFASRGYSIVDPGDRLLELLPVIPVDERAKEVRAIKIS